MTRNWTITGGRVLANDGFQETTLHIGDGVVSDDPSIDGTPIDATGLMVLPGIVDVHGDAFERQIMPRPGVSFDIGIALRETDRQMVANGITTAFHGVTISWEPGLRSPENAVRFVDAWQAARADLDCDTHLHLRWETYALESADMVRDWLRLDPKPILAFNDHTTMMLEAGVGVQKGRDHGHADGLTQEVCVERLHERKTLSDDVPGAIDGLAQSAADHDVTLLAHDERSPEERRHFRALGARASEFPLTLETAAEARNEGEHVVLGAPNVVRGGSHNNALTAEEAIRKDLCSVLASDYYYPAIFYAPFVLAQNEPERLAEFWKLVSTHPAELSGLHDRDGWNTSKRADLILVDARSWSWPRIVAVMIDGRMVYQRAVAA